MIARVPRQWVVSFVAGGLVAAALIVAQSPPSEAYTTVACPFGNYNIGIVGTSGIYKTRVGNTDKSQLHQADIKWAPPVQGSTATWFNGTPSYAWDVYSPGMSNTAYPKMMRGYSGGECALAATASNY
jgi:hypothetical protein